ncbi:MAG: hypothetical protein H7062_25410 [Candidatus Saccharimonas sp.]|nr:hypothetical protein [Planctomycetaceae bacterium]
MPSYATYTIDSELRISIPLEAFENPAWIRNGDQDTGSVGGIAMVGPRSGIQIAPQGGDFDKQRTAFLNRLSTPPKDIEASAAWMDMVRFYSACWKVLFHRHRKTYRLTIPIEAADLGLLTRKIGASITVVTDGEVLELWDKDKWSAYLQKVAASQMELHEQADELLRKRNATLGE